MKGNISSLIYGALSQHLPAGGTEEKATIRLSGSSVCRPRFEPSTLRAHSSSDTLLPAPLTLVTSVHRSETQKQTFWCESSFVSANI
jgi:hypothetical protein